MRLGEGTAALPGLLTPPLLFFFPISFPQQQSRSQVLPGHQPGERRRVPVGHQQQEGV